jgi:prepilin-type N-terminal cleavage/methylation domain-containing protein
MLPTVRPHPSAPHRLAVSPRRAGAGFSFVEVLVVMGIIAVLAGLGLAVVRIVGKKAPEVKTKNLLQKMRTNIDAWRGAYKATVPTDLQKLGLLGLPFKPGKPQPPNVTNAGIEAVVQCLYLPGFDHAPDIDGDLANTDDDRLDKALSKTGAADLFEVVDAWGNPLVYFTDADYANAEKSPPTLICGPESPDPGAAVNPKPWRNESGAFAQAGAYQLYSMGPDGQPNTEDDLKAWSN